MTACGGQTQRIIPATMGSHFYVVISCKTPQCGIIGALKYLGPDIAVVEIGEMAPTGVWYQCGACQKKHRYELEEMRVEESDLPPPPGWKSGW